MFGRIETPPPLPYYPPSSGFMSGKWKDKDKDKEAKEKEAKEKFQKLEKELKEAKEKLAKEEKKNASLTVELSQALADVVSLGSQNKRLTKRLAILHAASLTSYGALAATPKAEGTDLGEILSGLSLALHPRSPLPLTTEPENDDAPPFDEDAETA